METHWNILAYHIWDNYIRVNQYDEDEDDDDDDDDGDDHDDGDGDGDDDDGGGDDDDTLEYVGLHIQYIRTHSYM